ncbi:MAG: biopolymer transporter ExbD [Kiritimatiellae bacterium]|nr:biopolymer transporter ExbD [Kiritimatiellia bacterium]
MARHTPLTSLKQISEINLTPLMDLTFILLITFIITFPLIEQGIHVNLPHGKADQLEQDKYHSITLDPAGAVYLDDIPITTEELTAEMQRVKLAEPEVTVMVRADKDIRYAALVEIMKILHDAQITRMALVTQADN